MGVIDNAIAKRILNSQKVQDALYEKYKKQSPQQFQATMNAIQKDNHSNPIAVAIKAQIMKAGQRYQGDLNKQKEAQLEQQKKATEEAERQRAEAEARREKERQESEVNAEISRQQETRLEMVGQKAGQANESNQRNSAMISEGGATGGTGFKKIRRKLLGLDGSMGVLDEDKLGA